MIEFSLKNLMRGLCEQEKIRIFAFFLLIAIFIFNVPAVATGATYYVRTDGNDANPGTTNSAGGAWLTVQKAADTMVAGDKVLVQPGTYSELVVPANSGSSGSTITYEADGAVILDGQNTHCYAFQVISKDYLVIDGFEFTNYPDCGGAYANVYFDDSDFATVKNNVFHDTGRDAIGLYGSSTNGLVENNLIYDIDDDGITPSGSNQTLRNNTFYNCGGWAIEGAATGGNLYENNIIWDGIDNTGGSVTYSYNDYINSVLSGTGNISTDPLFINLAGRDFHLSHIAAGQGADSPAVDTGSATAASLGLDSRTTRTDGVGDSGTVDMGYHYESGSGPGDFTAPAAVTDLAAAVINSSSIELTWTAPGDDGSSGTASTYDIRYSTSPITAGNWNTATQATGEPAPQVAGSSEAFTVNGLSTGITYYFAIKTADEVPNWSGLSNVPSAVTTNMIYYVRTDGNDANPGTTNSAGGAWLTVQKAADTMVAGDKVLVQPGTYSELVVPANSGSSGSTITYEADGAVILDGQNTHCYAFQVISKDYLVIDGFEFTNYPDCGGAYANVYFDDSDFATVKNNVFHDTGRDAIGFYGSSTNGLVENNLIYDIDDDGITPSGSNQTLRNNTFYNCGGWAIEGAATGGNLYENNIIWDGIDNTGGSVTYSYNDYINSVLSGTGNISTDPLFINLAGRDFHLSHIAAGQGADSPAVDSGSATAASLGLDSRTTRTDGLADYGTVDMGYHYTASGAAVDTTPPAAITDLATVNATYASVELTWTAPGDDGSSGTASTYDIRYSTSLITAGNWNTATQATGEPAPQAAGSSEAFTVNGLSTGITYYFAIKTADEIPNWSALSNVPSASTLSSGGCGSSVVMVTGDGAFGGGVDDAAKKALLESWGYTVIAIDDDAPQATFDAAAASNDAMYISESVLSTTLNTKTRDLNIGIVVEERALEDDMEFVDSHTATNIGGTQININDNTHYITSPFGTGNLNVYDAAGILFRTEGTLASGAQLLATEPGGGFQTLFVFEAGAMLDGGSAAANRRVGFHFIHTSSTANWNNNLEALLRRSLEWASCGVAYSISGTVFEDVVINGGMGEPFNSGEGDVGISGVRVELFDASNIFQTFTTTDGSGNYNFSGLSASTNYKIRVVGSTVDAGVGALAEETFESDGTTNYGGFGTAMGGQNAATADTATQSTLSGAEHWVLIAVGTSNVSGVDFGFSYDLIVNTNNSGQGSLRQFITNANAIAGVQLSEFNIPTSDSNYNGTGNGEFTIRTSTVLPTVSDPVILDGTTQPEFVSTPVIEINGSLIIIDNVSGITITSGSSTVRGFVINGFSTDGSNGIRLQTGGNNTVEGNYLGTDTTGDVDNGNKNSGIHVMDSASNSIGGNTPAKRNVISGNDGYGIFVEGAAASNNTISGNFIGTNVNGTAALTNTFGVFLAGPNNTVGGTTPAERNIISGNTSASNNGFGIGITSTGNQVHGNYIGTDVNGTASIPNNYGVGMSQANNTIGGTTSEKRNTISGNTEAGIYVLGVAASGNKIQGNFIGTDVNGTAALPNSIRGIWINNAPNNTIGGTDAATRNIVSGNGIVGILVQNANATNNQIQGNYIGADVSGVLALGNGPYGVFFATTSNNTLGGSVAGSGNVIADHTTIGIALNTTSDIIIQGNYVGTDKTATRVLGNADGILWVNASNTVVGGTGNNEANVIANNTKAGVAAGAGTGNIISHNSIFNNGGLGIDLGNNAVTSNDTDDLDTGPNDLLNFPVIESVWLDTNTNTLILKGFARPGSIAEFFIAAPDPTGFGEGQTYLVTLVEGSVDDLDNTTGSYSDPQAGSDATNRFHFEIPVPGGVSAGTVLTATATDGTNNTSEFSKNITITAVPPNLTVVKSADTANADPGDVITCTVTVVNTGSGDSINVVLDDDLSPYMAWSLDAFGAGQAFEFTEGAPPSGLTLGTPVYSKDNGPPYTYTPVSQGGGAAVGFDGLVTNWRIPMSGTMNAGGEFTLRYKVMVK